MWLILWTKQQTLGIELSLNNTSPPLMLLQFFLTPIPAQDRVAWLPTLDGEFSVKRVYWFGHKMQLFHQYHHNPTSFNRNTLRFRQQLWRRNVLLRLSIWAWKASHNGLPSGDNLHKRHLISANTCTYCGQELKCFAIFFTPTP